MAPLGTFVIGPERRALARKSTSTILPFRETQATLRFYKLPMQALPAIRLGVLNCSEISINLLAVKNRAFKIVYV